MAVSSESVTSIRKFRIYACKQYPATLSYLSCYDRRATVLMIFNVITICVETEDYSIVYLQCIAVVIGEFGCYEVKITEEWQVPKRNCTSSLSHPCSKHIYKKETAAWAPCSVTEPQQPDNHQHSQSSIYSAKSTRAPSLTKFSDTVVQTCWCDWSMQQNTTWFLCGTVTIKRTVYPIKNPVHIKITACFYHV